MTAPQPIGAPFQAADALRLHECLTSAAYHAHEARECLLSINAAFRDTPAQLHDWIASLTRLETALNAAAEPLIVAAIEEETG